MQVELRIEPERSTPKVIILTASVTEEIAQLMNQLTSDASPLLAGIRDDSLTPLDPKDIIRIYAADSKVYATTAKGDFLLRQRLYELEERLRSRRFVRISHSELINLNMAKAFDLKLAGTICVSLEGGIVTYVSRRYVSKIKQVLGV